MSYAPRIVLRLPLKKAWALGEFVEGCLRDRVALIAIAGPGCEAMEDAIDDLIVGDGWDASRFIVTTSHTDETVEEVVAFAAGWSDPRPGVQVVSF